MQWKHRKMSNSIPPYCKIRDGKLVVNGVELFQSGSANSAFFQELYDLAELSYPKFFKMDNQSKLALLASVFLLKDFDKTQYAPEEWSVLLSCKNGSLDSDLKYWESTETIPSPALFIYTLPNVMIGEMCIHHGFKGETNCFVSDKFDPEIMFQQTTALLKNDASACIFGWVNFFQGNYEALLFLGEKDKEQTHSSSIQNIIN